MHRPFLAVATCFLGISSLAVALASVSFASSSGPLHTIEPDGVEVVRNYYGAVNHMIATGDASSLDDILGQAIIDQESGPSRREQFDRHIAFLHATAPATTIEPTMITWNGDYLVAKVAIGLTEPLSVMGFNLHSPSTLWPPVESFRVSGQRIIERWASREGLVTLLPDTEVGNELMIPKRLSVVGTLATYGPGASDDFRSGDGPTVLRVLAETIGIGLSTSATSQATVLSPAIDAVSPSSQVMAPGQSIRVGSGEVVIVPPRSMFTIANASGREASLLMLWSSRASDSAADFETPTNPPPSGINTRLLTMLQPFGRESPALIHFGTVLLTPGARLTVDESRDLMIICSTGSPHQCVTTDIRAEPDGIVRIDPFIAGETSATPLLILSKASDELVLLNAGDEPATMWVLSVATDGKTRLGSPASG